MKRIYIIFVFGLFPLTIVAQSTLDWLIDPTGSATRYVTSKAEEAAGNAWNGFLSDEINSSIASGAKRIAEYQPDTSVLARIDKKYRQSTRGEGKYGNAVLPLNKRIQSFLYQSPKALIQGYGKNALSKEVKKRVNDRADSRRQISLTEFFLASRPNLRALNDSWSQVPLMHNNVPMLYYWGVLAKDISFSVPRKYHLPDVESLSFKTSGTRVVEIYDTSSNTLLGEIHNTGNSILGNIVLNKVIVRDLALLNYNGIPNATYEVDNNVVYTTDILGRVVKVEQSCNKSNKQKSELNSKKLKAKHLVPKGCKSYALADLKYKGTISAINIIPLRYTKENKLELKEFKKLLKFNTKKGRPTEVVSTLLYNGTDNRPSEIIIRLDGRHFRLNVQ